ARCSITSGCACRASRGYRSCPAPTRSASTCPTGWRSGRATPNGPAWATGERMRCAGCTSTTRPQSTPGRPEPRKAEPLLLRLTAVGRELVAVEVADIAGISIGPEPARTDRTLILAAGGKRRTVKRRDRGAARRLEADRAAIGVRGGFPISRL